MELFYLSISFLDSPFLHANSFTKEINVSWKHTSDTNAPVHKHYFLAYNIKADEEKAEELSVLGYYLTLMCEDLYI